MRLSKYLTAATCGLLMISALAPAKAKGWLFQLPPSTLQSYATSKSGHRDNIFYVGQPVTFRLTGAGVSAYEVRDYWGNVVDQGSADRDLTINVSAPGWYKLYLYGSTSTAPWGNARGSTNFVIFRDDPHFPQAPDWSVTRSSFDATGAQDEVTRGVIALGPQRHIITNSSNADANIPSIAQNLSLDKQYYLGVGDPVRPRDEMLCFTGGGLNQTGVAKAATQLQGTIHYWEAYNEPNNYLPVTTFLPEIQSFAKTIKSVNPTLKVIGPGTVNIGPPSLGWIDTFFKSGGGNSIDAFSFHSYNATNGDLWLARTSFDALNALLAKYGQDKKEKWQTEQGFGAANYGVYTPRHQGRWTMLQTMVFEQYGIPKEHNVYWYDWSNGNWDTPFWWINENGGMNPAGALMRVWSEEVYGTKFAQAYDFGDPGNKMFLGSLFQGPNKSMAAFMSAGGTDGTVTLQVKGGSSLHVTSAFGVESDLAVVSGQVVLPVPEIPVYVDMAPGQTIQVVPLNWGTNLARQPGVTISASGSPKHPWDPSDSNDINKLINGQMESWYYDFTSNSRPWSSNVPDITQTPAWVEMDLPVPTQVNRVVIYCPVPWQFNGSLLDYEVQCDENGQWVTVSHTTEPAKSFPFFTSTVRCTEDTFYSDRCIFTDQFPAVKTGKIRILVHDCTWGQSVTKEVRDAGGQPDGHQVTIREIEVYSPYYNADQTRTIQGQIADSKGQGVVGATIALSGSQTKTATTGPGGAYSFSGLTEGGTYSLVPKQPNYAIQARTLNYGHLVGSQTCNFVASALPTGSGTGLLGEYFKDNYDEAHAFTPSYFKVSRIDSTINFSNWGVQTISPDFQILFATRWTGLIEPKYTEPCTFTLDADDGVRLWVNGQLLIDHWVRNQSQINTATINLVAGQRVDIHLEYFQLHGDAHCRLYWSSAHLPKEIVPSSRLYPAVLNVPPSVSLTTTQNDVPDGSLSPITLSADAKDLDGTIAKVVFSVNGQPVGTSTASPYGVAWQPAQASTYQVQAVAYDNTDAATVSDPVTLTVGADVQLKGSLQVRKKQHPIKAKSKPAAKKPAAKKPAAKKPAAKKPALKKPVVKKPTA